MSFDDGDNGNDDITLLSVNLSSLSQAPDMTQNSITQDQR